MISFELFFLILILYAWWERRAEKRRKENLAFESKWGIWPTED
jgi:hypothetical protein